MPTKKKPEFKFTITRMKDNPDGSCDVQVEMNDHAKERLIEAGVIALLKQHMYDTYEKLPWYKRLFKRRKIEIS